MCAPVCMLLVHSQSWLQDTLALVLNPIHAGVGQGKLCLLPLSPGLPIANALPYLKTGHCRRGQLGIMECNVHGYIGKLSPAGQLTLVCLVEEGAQVLEIFQ